MTAHPPSTLTQKRDERSYESLSCSVSLYYNSGSNNSFNHPVHRICIGNSNSNHVAYRPAPPIDGRCCLSLIAFALRILHRLAAFAIAFEPPPTLARAACEFQDQNSVRRLAKCPLTPTNETQALQARATCEQNISAKPGK